MEHCINAQEYWGRHQLVEKKEGATMSCKQCGTDLICRLKDYGGTYASSLQWQNHDGQAHYKTTDGKNFSCNVPDDDKDGQQTFIPNPPQATKIPEPKLDEILNKLNEISPLITRIYEMSEAIFHYTVDEQLKKK